MTVTISDQHSVVYVGSGNCLDGSLCRWEESIPVLKMPGGKLNSRKCTGAYRHDSVSVPIWISKVNQSSYRDEEIQREFEYFEIRACHAEVAATTDARVSWPPLSPCSRFFASFLSSPLILDRDAPPAPTRASSTLLPLPSGFPSFTIGLKERSYRHQYANIYFIRLHNLRRFVEERALKLWKGLDGTL